MQIKPLLIFCFLFSVGYGQVDRPWVFNRNSDTIYHTVISVTKRPSDDTSYKYVYLFDKVPHIAPKPITQIDTTKTFKMYMSFDTTSVLYPGGSSWSYIPAKKHRTKKRKHRYSHYTWTTDPGSKMQPRTRIKIGWYTIIDGEVWQVTDFPNITYKQWDSIGREYLLHKKYLQ